LTKDRAAAHLGGLQAHINTMQEDSALPVDAEDALDELSDAHKKLCAAFGFSEDDFAEDGSDDGTMERREAAAVRVPRRVREAGGMLLNGSQPRIRIDPFPDGGWGR
jgi:hypothetical protein